MANEEERDFLESQIMGLNDNIQECTSEMAQHFERIDYWRERRDRLESKLQEIENELSMIY